MAISGGTPTPETSRYLFIDGAYLCFYLREIGNVFFSGATPEIDFEAMRQGHLKVFYYDCLPAQKPDEVSEDFTRRKEQQEKLFRKLRSLKGFHVYEGRIRQRGERPVQKMVDTMIAVDLLTHAYRRNASELTLLAGDLDFKPVIEAAVQNGAFVTLWYGPRNTNRDLLDAADERLPMTVQKIHTWCTDSFKKGNALPYTHTSVRGEEDNWTTLRSGRTSTGLPLILFEKDGVHCIALHNDEDSTTKTYVRHKEIGFLEEYVKDVYCDFFWTATP